MNFDSVAKKVGCNIRVARIQKGVPFVDLSRRAKIGKGTLSEIENGGNPCLRTLTKICQVLRINLKDLV